jgi:Protein of unknown function (DUF1488)
MALSFPNMSRRYDAARQSVCFWGYDSAFEISFYIGVDALRSISSQSNRGETAFLEAFDANREWIQRPLRRSTGNVARASTSDGIGLLTGKGSLKES